MRLGQRLGWGFLLLCPIVLALAAFARDGWLGILVGVAILLCLLAAVQAVR